MVGFSHLPLYRASQCAATLLSPFISLGVALDMIIHTKNMDGGKETIEKRLKAYGKEH
jgi:hypothetical protein